MLVYNNFLEFRFYLPFSCGVAIDCTVGIIILMQYVAAIRAINSRILQTSKKYLN